MATTITRVKTKLQWQVIGTEHSKEARYEQPHYALLSEKKKKYTHRDLFTITFKLVYEIGWYLDFFDGMLTIRIFE